MTDTGLVSSLTKAVAQTRMSITFNDFLLETFNNDLRKVNCVLDYLKHETDFIERFNSMHAAEFDLYISEADSQCVSSALTSPLGVAAIVSVTVLGLFLIGIFYGCITRRRVEL